MNKPQFLLLPDKTAPLVFIDFALKAGSINDPVGKGGVASLTMSMLLRGTKKYSAKEFHEALDLLGAEIHLGKNKESLRLHGVVLRENLKAFIRLFREALGEPRFDPVEFAKLKTQFKSALLDELSSDDDIADRRFQEHLLWGHPYGNMVSGNITSIDAITLEDLREFYEKNFAAGGAIFSAMGAFDRAAMKKELESMAKVLPAKQFERLEVGDLKWPQGKNVLLLHKPERTQSQIIIATKGVGFHDANYTAMQLANHVFGGGSFSARLMKEVREKRGWSYGAYAGFRAGRKPICLSMQTVPATKDTVAAMSLMIKLLHGFAKKGITKEEFAFAKKSLVNQAAFMQDTLKKRLDNKVTEQILELPKDFYDGYLARLEKMTYARVQKAIQSLVSDKNLFVVILGDAALLESELRKSQAWKRFIKKDFADAPGAIF